CQCALSLSKTHANSLVQSNDFTYNRDGSIALIVYHLHLIIQNIRNFHGLVFFRNNCLKIHPVAADKKGRNLEPRWRIRSVNVSRQRFHITELTVLPGQSQKSVFRYLRQSTELLPIQ